MTLKGRLSQLQSQAGSRSVVRDARAKSPPLQNRLATLRPGRLYGREAKTAPRLSEKQLAQALQGTVIADGLIKIEKRIPFNEPLGNTQLQLVNDIQRLPGESEFQPGIYIDTETTGLAGGSGTLAFLIGIAIVGKKTIKLIQFLMTRYAAEAAMIGAFIQSLPADYRFISYNGKSYDIPLLRTRFRMQGMSDTSLDRGHLDLLHPVRRLFSKRWSNCRLTTLEQQLLGFYRKDDLPGSEAPEAWFNYLRHGYSQKLIKVVEHNRQDIVSLAVAHALLGKAINNPHFYRVDIYSLARWFSENSEPEAIVLLESHHEKLCGDGKRLLAHLYRRKNQWHKAVPIWESLAQIGCRESMEKLAKFHEHVSNDLQKAWYYCHQLPGSEADIHRGKRIQKKLIKSNLPGLDLRITSSG